MRKLGWSACIAMIAVSWSAKAFAVCNDDCLDKLKKEIAVLDSSVTNLSAAIVRPSVDAAAWLDKWALEFALEKINSTNRKLSFRSNSASGRFAGDDWDCGWFGRGGWSITPLSDEAGAANMELGKFHYAWQPGVGMKFDVVADMEAFLAIKYRFDPCIGGGWSWPGFAIGKTNPAPRLEGFIGVTTNEKGAFVIDVHGKKPPKIWVALLATGLPFLYWPFDSGVVGSLTELDLSSVWDDEGVIKIPQPDGTYLEQKYKLSMGASAASIKGTGYDATFALTVVLQ